MVILTKLEKKDFEKILAKYNLGKYLSHIFAETYETTVYILNTTKGKFVLKVFEKIPLKELIYQFKLVDYVYSKKIPVVKNIKSKRNEEIIRYKGKNLAIQGFIDGHKPETFGNILIKDIARNIAKMHKALLRINIKGLKECKDIEFKERKLEGYSDSFDIYRFQKDLFKELNNLPKQKLKKTHIHGDLSEVNLLVKNKKLKAIIDWSDADYGFITYDLAVFIAHDFIRSKAIYKNKIRLFLKEYQKYLKLNEEEKKALYYLIKYRLLIILYWYFRNIKLHKDKTATMKRGIKRSIARLENFNKISLDEFLSWF